MNGIKLKRLLFLFLLIFVSTVSYAEWEYSQSEDKMTNKITKNAVIESKSFSLPYTKNTLQYGHLYVRQHPKYGLSVMLKLTEGSIVCIIYNCEINVRFDSAQPIIFNGK